MDKHCENCNKLFSKPSRCTSWRWKKVRFCGALCTGRFNAKHRKIDPETEKLRRLKISKTSKGHLVSVATRLKIGAKNRIALLGKRISPKTEFKQGHKTWNVGLKGYWTGERNPRWKGGITPLVMKIRNCFLYRQWRSDVFTRDNFTCQLCGKRGGNLEADHFPKKFSDVFSENKIISFLQAMLCEELWNINNGRTLCVLCHDKTKEGRKKL